MPGLACGLRARLLNMHDLARVEKQEKNHHQCLPWDYLPMLKAKAAHLVAMSRQMTSKSGGKRFPVDIISVPSVTKLSAASFPCHKMGI